MDGLRLPSYRKEFQKDDGLSRSLDSGSDPQWIEVCHPTGGGVVTWARTAAQTSNYGRTTLIVWLQVCLVRLLVMPRLVATTGLHRGQNAHQSRLFSTLVQHLFDPFLLAELLLTSNKFDLDSVRGGDTLHVLPNGVAQRLCPLRVVENADLVLVEVVRHALGVAPLWNRPLDDDPVVAGKNASDLALVPLGQEFDAHSGIITDILFGSGYAGLGVFRPDSFEGCILVRIPNRVHPSQS